MTPHLEASLPAYEPRDPSATVLYRVVADHLETFVRCNNSYRTPYKNRVRFGGYLKVSRLT
jgi:hypothetical protein